MYFDTRVYIPGLELSHELLPKEVTPIVSYCPSEPILIKGPPEIQNSLLVIVRLSCVLAKQVYVINH